MRHILATAVITVPMILLAGCASEGGQDPGPPSTNPHQQRYPDVIDVTVERTDGTYSFTVTISSPYDTPERYADGWRIIGPDGSVYGEHTLAHDHANEQPFTRTQTGVQVPPGVREVTVEARDQRYGYGGATASVPLPGG